MGKTSWKRRNVAILREVTTLSPPLSFQNSSANHPVPEEHCSIRDRGQGGRERLDPGVELEERLSAGA